MQFRLYGLAIALALGLYVLWSAIDASRRRGGRAKRGRLGSREVFAACVLAILAITLVPLEGPHHLQLVPFTDGTGANDVGNLLLFAPLGGVLYLRRWPTPSAVAFGFALSLTIEIVQLGISGRTTSTDDVIFNTAGAALGYLVGRAVWRRVAAGVPA